MTATLRKTTRLGLVAAATVPDEIVADMYFRLSDLREEDMNEDGQGKTFQYREAKLRTFIKELGWTPGVVIIENDEIEKERRKNGKVIKRVVRGASAFKRRKILLPDGTIGMRVYRPGFRKILGRLDRAESHALVAEDLDRVMRDQYDAEDLLAIVERRRANTRSLTGTGTLTNGGTADEQFMVRLYVNIANKSSADTARRVAAARERKALAGEYGGGRRPFGFEPDPYSTWLRKRPAECDVIAEMSRRVLQIDGRTRKNVSLRSLALELRDRVEVLPDGFIGPPRHLVPTVTGAPWTPETLRDILLRPLNANMGVYKDEVLPDVRCYEGEPVVPRDVYDAVVTVLTDESRRNGPGSAPKHLLTNIGRCGLCTPPGVEPTRTKTMHVCMSRNSYRCSHTGHLSIQREPFEAHVVSRVLSLLSLPDAADLFTPTRPDVDVEALRAESDALRVKLNELTELFTDGVIDRAQLRAGSEKAKARQEEINREITNAVVDSPVADLWTQGVDVVEWWTALPLANKRLVVDSLVTVIVMPTNKRRGFDPSRVLVIPKNKNAEVAA